MIVRMEKLAVCGLSEDKERLLRELMRRGCVQLRSPETVEELSGLLGSVRQDSAALYDQEQRSARLRSVMEFLNPYVQKKGMAMFQPRMRVAYDRYGRQGVAEAAEQICRRVEENQKKTASLKAELTSLEAEKASLLPWKESDLPVEIASTARCEILYVFAKNTVSADMLAEAAGQAGAAVFPLGADTAGGYFILIFHKNDRDAVLEALRPLEIGKITLGGKHGTPLERIAEADRRMGEIQTELSDLEALWPEIARGMDALYLAGDGLLLSMERTKAGGQLFHTERTFLLCGWVPREEEETIRALFSEYPCYYEFTEAAQDDPEMPVLLKNPKWARPFESITEMYALPMPGSVDPDPFIAPFYFVFFGMMLSDAGYGLILLLGGLFLLKKAHLGSNGRKLVQTLTICGVSTVIWGLIYGSFFGDLPAKIASTFFQSDFALPMLIDPLGEPMVVLALSMALGLLHTFVGMALSIYLMCKRHDVFGAIVDVGVWYLILIGLLMLLLGGVWQKVGMAMAAVGALTVVCFRGREKKNIILRVGSGLVGLYDISGYFSDVLSYSRILALGLATGVISSVINIFGTLPGPNILSVLMILVVGTGGHLLNFAINALGAYVHTSRLHYVEFFGRFYEGGGTPFRPLAAETKYTEAVTCLQTERE
ncbi:MAG TPA: V-type ATP synthase subunit I [Oscillospiraceae bacterium]|nr:V-type ATP synthase subunit I [Oscillospiraceae bacterium]HNW04356.1 V-type ATP synthase subunit I [Oscillospiraceae bacterium]